LKQKGLVFELHSNDSFEKQLFDVLTNRKTLSSLFEQINGYLQEMELNDSQSIINVMKSLLERKSYVVDRGTFMEKLYPAIWGRSASASSYTSGNSN